MSRFKRRTLAAVVGLSLGWIAAGMTFSTANAQGDAATAPAPAAAPAPAEPDHAEKTVPAKPVEAPAAAPAADAPHADRVAPAKPAHAAKVKAEPTHAAVKVDPHALSAAAHGADDDSNIESDESKVAHSLVPGSEEQIAWFKPVVGIIVALFVAAGLLGWLAAAAKGPPPPEPADDHGHDAKHDAGHGHGHGHDAPASGGH